MAPNGKAINLKKRYSCSASDALISTLFTSDSTKPSIEIGTSPYSGTFKFEALLNQGAYYDLENKLLFGVEYQVEKNEIAPVIDYRSFPPANIYEGDRYLVIATASDPNWTSSSSTEWSDFVGMVVERNSVVNPVNVRDGLIISLVSENDIVFVKNKSEYITLLSGKLVKSYHSNTSSISELLNANKTISGVWKLLVMDTASIDKGFVEEFELSFSYKSSYVINTLKNDAVWHDGIFNGGQFIDLGVWKSGKFNGGKFISTFGYEKSGSYLSPSEKIEEYSWQSGEFNGGEFGNESLLSNSTWFNGEFNGGVFKGKLWNNGIFTYGEFKGGSSIPVVGSGIRSEKAQGFIDSFKGDYYGVWRNGVVSDKKENFIEDKKLFSTPTRAVSPEKLGKSAQFENMLWVAGTFDHPSGEIKNSAWLNGNFKMGVFRSSAFNPYVKRNSDKLEFVKDDSCIWENGKLIDSEFHISKWKYGHFISGTAVGMIWQDGIVNYMNAHNIFWEKGVWRNGNWYGSNFDYKGKVEDGLVKEVLNRGIEWSGAPYCHVWNIFENVSDKTSRLVSSQLTKSGGDSFTTTNIEDGGSSEPKVGSEVTIDKSEKYYVFTIISNGGIPIKEFGFIYTENEDQATANSNPPAMTSTGQSGLATSGTTIFKYIAGIEAGTSFTPDDETTGWQPGDVFMPFSNMTLNPNKWYSITGYAINEYCDTVGPSLTAPKVFQPDQPNTIATNTLTSTNISTTVNNTYTQQIKEAIVITSTYTANTTSMPQPGERGIVYKHTAIGDLVPTSPTIDDRMVTSEPYNTVNNPFTSTISSVVVVAKRVYYIRSYTKNDGGVGYGPLITITSGVSPPTVTLTTPTTQLEGNVTNTGGSSTLKRGFIIFKTTISPPAGVFNNSQNSAAGVRPSDILTASDPNSTLKRIECADGDVGSFSVLINNISDLTNGFTYKVYAYSEDSSIKSYAYSTALTFTK